MVVQTVQKEEEEPIELIEIPEKVPEEIIENDSLLTIESNINELEDKVMVTARSLLSMTHELRTQINEIERLENAFISTHEYIVSQNNRIVKLEGQVEENRKLDEERNSKNNSSRPGFWARLFSS